MIVEYKGLQDIRVYVYGIAVTLRRGQIKIASKEVGNYLIENDYVTLVSSGGTDTPVDESLAQEIRSFISTKAKPDGLASLDSRGKLLTSQIPDSILGSVKYCGVWDADKNTPQLPAPSKDNLGYYYVVSNSGKTQVGDYTEWVIGDWVISDGTRWDRVDNNDSVLSVNGKYGVIVLDKKDVGLSEVTNQPQMVKAESSKDGYLPVWDGTSGTKLKLGYQVGTMANGILQLNEDKKLPELDGSNVYNVNSNSSNLLETTVFS